MVRVTFGPREEVESIDYNASPLVQEYQYEFETVEYRLLDKPDSPTKYDESAHSIKVGNDTVYVAIRVQATKR